MSGAGCGNSPGRPAIPPLPAALPLTFHSDDPQFVPPDEIPEMHPGGVEIGQKARGRTAVFLRLDSHLTFCIQEPTMSTIRHIALNPASNIDMMNEEAAADTLQWWWRARMTWYAHIPTCSRPLSTSPSGVEYRATWLAQQFPENSDVAACYGVHSANDRTPNQQQQRPIIIGGVAAVPPSVWRRRGPLCVAYARDGYGSAFSFLLKLIPAAQHEVKLWGRLYCSNVNATILLSNLRALGLLSDISLSTFSVAASYKLAPTFHISSFVGHTPENLEELIYRIGATPSLFAAIQVAHSSRNSPRVYEGDTFHEWPTYSDLQPDIRLLDTIWPTSVDDGLNQCWNWRRACKKLLWGNAPRDPSLSSAHSETRMCCECSGQETYLLRACSSKLIHGLAVKIHEIEARCKSLALPPIVPNALGVIQNLGLEMSFHRRSLTVCSRLLELLGDELFTVLSVLRPYTVKDIKTAIASIISTRYSQLVPYLRCVGIVSSGMEAITTALRLFININNGKHSPVCQLCPERDYLEVQYLLADAVALEETDEGIPVFYYTPNPSNPTAGLPPPVEQLFSRISERAQSAGFSTLVIDVTLEKPNDTHFLELISCACPLIESGKLCLVLVKSYVKYATLGTSKASTGSLSVFHNGDSKFRRLQELLASHERECEWQYSSEVQYVTHVLHYASEFELKLLERAAKGAAFAAGHLWTSSLGRGPDICIMPGMPFLAFPKSTSRWAIQNDTCPGRLQTLTAAALVNLLGLHDRDSFSSPESSALAMPEVVRINVGQESVHLLCEKFFAVGTLLKAQPSKGLPVKITLLSVQKSLEQFCIDHTISRCAPSEAAVTPLSCTAGYIETVLSLSHSPTELCFITSVIASFLLFAVRVLVVKLPPDSTTLQSMLRAFLGNKSSLSCIRSTSVSHLISALNSLGA
ncbi:hypothetical protein Pelo_15160 [Pelomyxa schiedti]|nr:hypothetical protein Pelo_15160 [Pelomyxa schiedti]